MGFRGLARREKQLRRRGETQEEIREQLEKETRRMVGEAGGTPEPAKQVRDGADEDVKVVAESKEKKPGKAKKEKGSEEVTPSGTFSRARAIEQAKKEHPPESKEKEGKGKAKSGPRGYYPEGGAPSSLAEAGVKETESEKAVSTPPPMQKAEEEKSKPVTENLEEIAPKKPAERMPEDMAPSGSPSTSVLEQASGKEVKKGTPSVDYDKLKRDIKNYRRKVEKLRKKLKGNKRFRKASKWLKKHKGELKDVEKAVKKAEKQEKRLKRSLSKKEPESGKYWKVKLDGKTYYSKKKPEELKSWKKLKSSLSDLKEQRAGIPEDVRKTLQSEEYKDIAKLSEKVHKLGKSVEKRRKKLSPEQTAELMEETAYESKEGEWKGKPGWYGVWPTSLEMEEAGERFAKRHKNWPGPTEEIVGGVAKVGGMMQAPFEAIAKPIVSLTGSHPEAAEQSSPELVGAGMGAAGVGGKHAKEKWKYAQARPFQMAATIPSEILLGEAIGKVGGKVWEVMPKPRVLEKAGEIVGESVAKAGRKIKRKGLEPVYEKVTGKEAPRTVELPEKAGTRVPTEVPAGEGTATTPAGKISEDAVKEAVEKGLKPSDFVHEVDEAVEAGMKGERSAVIDELTSRGYTKEFAEQIADELPDTKAGLRAWRRSGKTIELPKSEAEKMIERAETPYTEVMEKEPKKVIRFPESASDEVVDQARISYPEAEVLKGEAPTRGVGRPTAVIEMGPKGEVQEAVLEATGKTPKGEVVEHISRMKAPEAYDVYPTEPVSAGAALEQRAPTAAESWSARIGGEEAPPSIAHEVAPEVPSGVSNAIRGTVGLSAASLVENKTVPEVKKLVKNRSLRPEEALEAERKGKNRKTFKKWLKKQAEPSRQKGAGELGPTTPEKAGESEVKPEGKGELKPQAGWEVGSEAEKKTGGVPKPKPGTVHKTEQVPNTIPEVVPKPEPREVPKPKPEITPGETPKGVHEPKTGQIPKPGTETKPGPQQREVFKPDTVLDVGPTPVSVQEFTPKVRTEVKERSVARSPETSVFEESPKPPRPRLEPFLPGGGWSEGESPSKSESPHGIGEKVYWVPNIVARMVGGGKEAKRGEAPEEIVVRGETEKEIGKIFGEADEEVEELASFGGGENLEDVVGWV